ncbi:hypothetical protein K435DRAFT_877684 [Dendrothele bispora CBS 962.96]|uniref:Uncharacterized protein n=1 Tax=Dendrothele bispora (strain CBS 962.96) TaxID=1314807 RepID=A0A4S8KPD9_DENBC|nr:hypothetical protein K435DRAFT_877684 [Dendrothele bispora CBS 962.96]
MQFKSSIILVPLLCTYCFSLAIIFPWSKHLPSLPQWSSPPWLRPFPNALPLSFLSKRPHPKPTLLSLKVVAAVAVGPASEVFLTHLFRKPPIPIRAQPLPFPSSSPPLLDPVSPNPTTELLVTTNYISPPIFCRVPPLEERHVHSFFFLGSLVSAAIPALYFPLLRSFHSRSRSPPSLLYS